MANARRSRDVSSAAALSVLAQALLVSAQDSVEQVRNSYNFVQAGLSTLAAGASVALCLARGRLDSEMGLADFFTTTRLTRQNEYGAMRSLMGNNGSIVGINVLGPSPNTIKWVAHNTWVLGNLTTLVPFWKSNEHIPVPPVPAQPTCTCWHIPSLSAQGTGRPSVVETPPHELGKMVEPQCCRILSYQCDLHGKDHMHDLHTGITQNFRGVPLSSAMLQGPSQLYQWMLEDEQHGVQCTYLFAVDRLGAGALARMVSESLATLDSSQKGRTSDLVDWSLGKLQLSEKPDVKWIASAAAVVLVGVTEFVLLLLFSLVFGLDPFVSSLGARRGVRSLRLGTNGVTQFADLWLKKVNGREILDWRTPILRVVPRKDLTLSYLDSAIKISGLVIASVYWALTVFGYTHPLGLQRNAAWRSTGIWAVYVAVVGNVIGIVTSGLPFRLESSLPGQSHDPGYGMMGYSIIQCFGEVALTSLRMVPRFRNTKWLLRWWYVMLEVGIWIQWCAAKRSLHRGPQSDTTPAWELTLIQAGALARAAVLAAVSGKWKS